MRAKQIILNVFKLPAVWTRVHTVKISVQALRREESRPRYWQVPPVLHAHHYRLRKQCCNAAALAALVPASVHAASLLEPATTPSGQPRRQALLPPPPSRAGLRGVERACTGPQAWCLPCPAQLCRHQPTPTSQTAWPAQRGLLAVRCHACAAALHDWTSPGPPTPHDA